MLSEHQIQRYARHILLPEVGGAGQEKLLASVVKARGEREWVELAAAFLAAAGVRVDVHSGQGLELASQAGWVSARALGDAILLTSSSCAACAGAPSGPLSVDAAAVAAALAASEMLRLILGIGEPTRGWRIRGASIEHLAPELCVAHRGPR